MRQECMDEMIGGVEKYPDNMEVRLPYRFQPLARALRSRRAVGCDGSFAPWARELTRAWLCSVQAAAKVIKEAMDKKYGGPWHCIVGEGFGFSVQCVRHPSLLLSFHPRCST